MSRHSRSEPEKASAEDIPARGGQAGGVLRELRGEHGGPHLGTRALALLLVLLLAAPLTALVWVVARYLLGTVI